VVGENISLGPLGPVGGLAVSEWKSGTSAREKLCASVAQVTASPHSCDTPKPAGPCTCRQQRTAGGGFAVAWRIVLRDATDYLNIKNRCNTFT
jgi:hypothetical protein